MIKTDQCKHYNKALQSKFKMGVDNTSLLMSTLSFTYINKANLLTEILVTHILSLSLSIVIQQA